MSKLQAAQQQLEGSIANLFLGNWACAITLAGAAEDVLQNPNGEADLFNAALKIGQEKYNKTSSEIVEMYNEKRNWLKHHQVNNPKLKQSLDFTQEDAVIIILRAYTRFSLVTQATSENIEVFETWFRNNHADWLEPDTTDSIQGALA